MRDLRLRGLLEGEFKYQSRRKLFPESGTVVFAVELTRLEAGIFAFLCGYEQRWQLSQISQTQPRLA
jgi:hypothetical protein